MYPNRHLVPCGGISWHDNLVLVPRTQPEHVDETAREQRGQIRNNACKDEAEEEEYNAIQYDFLSRR